VNVNHAAGVFNVVRPRDFEFSVSCRQNHEWSEQNAQGHEQRLPDEIKERSGLRFVAHAETLTPTENCPRNSDNHGGDEEPPRVGSQTRKDARINDVVVFSRAMLAHAVIPSTMNFGSNLGCVAG
jgi:hypothetical protein